MTFTRVVASTMTACVDGIWLVCFLGTSGLFDLPETMTVFTAHHSRIFHLRKDSNNSKLMFIWCCINKAPSGPINGTDIKKLSFRPSWSLQTATKSSIAWKRSQQSFSISARVEQWQDVSMWVFLERQFRIIWIRLWKASICEKDFASYPARARIITYVQGKCLPNNFAKCIHLWKDENFLIFYINCGFSHFLHKIISQLV